ncbi:MAG: mechanosensitive ion channel family protein, partial [Pararhodobacter sp.]
RVLQRHQPGREIQDGVEVDVAPFFDRVVSLGKRALVLFGFAAPVLGAVGYIAAATMLTYPPIRSLAVIALAIVVHRLIVAIWGAITGDDEGAGRGLVPALAGLLLSLLALIPLSLIWGARETDLLEMWTRFSAGTSLGGARISPASVLWFFIVFGIGFAVTRIFQRTLGTSVLPKTSMEKGAQKAIVSGMGYLGIAVAALVAFSVAGIDLSGLAIVAGALSVGVGFGLQNIVSNFVSGIILLIERPVSEGDWIEVGPTQGIVERISVRSTMIETFDKSQVIVPNSDLISGAVTNFTKSSRTGRLVMKVGVAYGSDTRKVQAILRDIIENEPVVVLDPAPGVDFLGFGADSMDFQIRAIVRDVSSRLPLQSEVNHKIAERFAEEGIEIPFAQRDIWIRNPEALVSPQPKPPAPEPAGPPEPEADRDTADNASVSVDDIDPPFREQTR